MTLYKYIAATAGMALLMGASASATPSTVTFEGVSRADGSTLMRADGITFDVTAGGVLERLDITVAADTNTPWLTHSLSSDSTALATYSATNGNPKSEGILSMDVELSSPTQLQWSIEFNTAHPAWQRQLMDAPSVDMTLTATAWDGSGGSATTSLTYRVMNAAKADYDGDGISDKCVYRKDGKMEWISSKSGDTNVTTHALEDVYPVAGDFNGDGLCDFVWFTKANVGQWDIIFAGDTTLHEYVFGPKNSVPAVGDYDGDGVDDLGVILTDGRLRWWKSTSPSNWFESVGGSKIIKTTGFGGPGLKAAQGDYDGDGFCDRAWYEPSKAKFTIVSTLNGGKVWRRYLGGSAAIPVPGDYDGDGRADVAVMHGDRRVSWLRSDSGNKIRRKTMATRAWLRKYKDATFAGGDYNGDGISDLVWFLNTGAAAGNTWHMRRSVRTLTSVAFPAMNVYFGAEDSYPVTGSVDGIMGPHLPIIYPANFNGTLWKTPNHSHDGTVVLVASSFMADYQAGLWEKAVVSTDPSGENVLLPWGVGRIVAPYHERPAIRFDVLGSWFGPGPVYMVIIYKDGRRQPWYLPNPGLRTE
ncbi:MAG: VCBS repeat-containing protein [Verrucomicrobia bacterium]|nr:VCBS repeat-containing protein [Verrucomicrobiota bacterium]MBT7066084.1 VCBS repeat-containing protein [Verrucomicrobiota bacterium]MBT7700294.1 VCBS repeat-containing protein [Verrucomicrobiota bacterium]